MSESSSASNESLNNLMDNLKRGNYFETIPKIQEKLHLKNYPPAKIEALLINTTVDCFYKVEKDKHKIDIVLVALGLLKGFDNRPRDTECDNVPTAKKLYTSRITKLMRCTTYIQKIGYNSFKELEKTGETETKIDSLQAAVRRDTRKLALKIYNEKNIDQYIKESVEKYPSPITEYIPEECLPDMFYYEWLKKDTMCTTLSAGYYIKLIRESQNHNDMAKELYMVLCESEPPQEEWIKSWLISHINKIFKDTIDRDIMLVSFTLLPGYELEGKGGLERRLNKYLWKNIYYDTHPYTSREPIEHILGMGTKEETEIKNELKTREKRLVNELIRHIETMDCSEHIKDIKEVSSTKYQSHTSQTQDIFFSRKNIEIVQEMQKITKRVSIASIIILSCIFLGIYPLQIYKARYEEQLRKEGIYSAAWEKIEIDQDTLLTERTSKDNNNKEFYGEPVQIEWSNDTNLIPLKDTEDAG